MSNACTRVCVAIVTELVSKDCSGNCNPQLTSNKPSTIVENDQVDKVLNLELLVVRVSQLVCYVGLLHCARLERGRLR